MNAKVDNKGLQEPKAAPTVRETIEASLKELELAPTDKDDVINEDNNEHEPSEDPAAEDILEDVLKKKKETTEVEEPEEEEIEIEEEIIETKPEPKKTKIAAPDNWKDTQDWDKTPASVRQKIIKREEEISAGFKQYGEKAREFDKYEQFVGPRRQSMAKIGVSPEQVIGRALDWMDALGHPDPKVRGDSFKLLARNFGFDLASIAEQNATGESFRVGADGQQTEIPAQLKEYVSQLEQKIGGLEQQLGGLHNNYTSQQDRAAAAYLSNWAKDKPHFAKVQPQMVALIQGGTVPLASDGSLDLDTAYDMAVYAVPEIRQLVVAEKADKAKKDAAAKANTEKRKKDAQLSKARAANGSLKPGSASLVNGQKDARGMSVRDTIKLSLQQMNG